MLSRDALRDLDASPAFAQFVCARAGLDCVVGERETWTIAGHELVVELELDKRVLYVFYVRSGWPSSPELRPRKSLCLAEVYAIMLTAQIRDFGGPELARFKVRALAEAGLIELAHVALPELARSAPGAAKTTWAVIAELATIRAATGDTGPMPLVAPWLAAWSGTDESTIRAGKRWLEQHAFIVHVDDAPGRFGNATKLWALMGLDQTSIAPS